MYWSFKVCVTSTYLPMQKIASAMILYTRSTVQLWCGLKIVSQQFHRLFSGEELMVHKDDSLLGLFKTQCRIYQA